MPAKPMTRNERLSAYLVGKKRGYVAVNDLGMTDPRDLSTLLRINIDEVMRRIDRLPVASRKQQRPIQ